ncbi:hypothetical protein PTI45_02051 [Paenibacillus nuruki]|uniref:SF3 helicase domain-containing protein n=1 Tax=Paenibacillus nuruki TaxID=1886670 RepID=A0A1E3L438_9BACL|nr:phage/plasmid primase, P4 family [Paenibacillus nuruki]ODP28506.1 hypothetical protein PTI45_02051 [Paenibacillus nuruki]
MKDLLFDNNKKTLSLNSSKSPLSSQEFSGFRQGIVTNETLRMLTQLIEGVIPSHFSSKKVIVPILKNTIFVLLKRNNSSMPKETARKATESYINNLSNSSYSTLITDISDTERDLISNDQYFTTINNPIQPSLPLSNKNISGSLIALLPHKTTEKMKKNYFIKAKTVGKPVSLFKKEKYIKLSNHEIAELLAINHKFAVINQNLHYWEPALGHFIGLVGEKSDMFIRKNIPNNLKNLITARSVEEIVKWLISDKRITTSNDSLVQRKNYIPFKNGVVSINDLSRHEHSPSFYFTSVINAHYPSAGVLRGETFESFMDQVTGGSKSEYWRLQELFGYVLSEIRDVKVLPFLIGPKDSCKSIVLKLLSHMVGEQHCSSLSLEQMNQSDYLCQLFAKKLNTFGEISEIPVKRLDTLKKLSGGDPLTARYLYGKPIKFVNQAALLFAGNFLPVIKGMDRSNAFIERLEVFSFEFQVPKDKQDIYLFKKIRDEKSYIAWWALQGLQRWIENNHQFTKSETVELIIQDYKITDNSVQSFLDRCCILRAGYKEYNSVLYEAYEGFCEKENLVVKSTKTFHKSMQDVAGLRHHKFRKEGSNGNGYDGIQLTLKEEQYGDL